MLLLQCIHALQGCASAAFPCPTLFCGLADARRIWLAPNVADIPTQCVAVICGHRAVPVGSASTHRAQLSFHAPAIQPNCAPLRDLRAVHSRDLSCLGSVRHIVQARQAPDFQGIAGQQHGTPCRAVVVCSGDGARRMPSALAAHTAKHDSPRDGCDCCCWMCFGHCRWRCPSHSSPSCAGARGREHGAVATRAPGTRPERSSGH